MSFPGMCRSYLSQSFVSQRTPFLEEKVTGLPLNAFRPRFHRCGWFAVYVGISTENQGEALGRANCRLRSAVRSANFFKPSVFFVLQFRVMMSRISNE